jgi:3-deoxy-manno-octulosonate cytidylyltransferase (CMP-KDO synthetase)
MLDIAILIPARLDSKRLRNKPLIKFNDIEMIEIVRRKAELNSYSIPVYVVSGDNEIITLIKNYGGLTLFSTKDHNSGLSRVLEFSKEHKFSKTLILQGDEILIDPKIIDEFIKKMMIENFEIINGVTPLNGTVDIDNLNIVKCLVDRRQNIISIFRKSPLISPPNLQLKYLRKILGIFAINNINNNIHNFDSELTISESIEQLNFLDNSLKIMALEFEANLHSVNTFEDIEICLKEINTNKRQMKLFDEIQR